MLNQEIAELFGVTEGYVAENLDFIKDIIQSSTGVGEVSLILGEDEKAGIEDAEGAEDTVYGVKIVEDDEIVAPKEEKMEQPKAEKVKCRCCGFAKKPRRVNAEGICKVCYVALATSDGNVVTVVGRQGRKGRNTVSVVVGGVRVKVQRKVRMEA
jgi:hypothetical protein